MAYRDNPWPYGPGAKKPVQLYQPSRHASQSGSRQVSGGQTRPNGLFEAFHADKPHASPARKVAPVLSPYEAHASTPVRSSPARSNGGIYEQSQSTRSPTPRSTTTVNRQQPDMGTREQEAGARGAASPGGRFYPDISNRNVQRRGEYDEPISGGGPSDISDSSSSDEAIATEISLKLKLIRKALVACKAVCEEYENEFQLHAGKLTWAKKDTLDKLWCDMIANHGKPDGLPKATEKLKASMGQLKSFLDASRNAERSRRQDDQDTEVLECRQRAAGYTEYRYNGLLDLLHRTRTERPAGRMLLGEIRELISELDPKTHPVLYDEVDEDGEEERPTKQGPVKGPKNAKQGGKGPVQNGRKSALKSQAPKGSRNSPSRGNTPRSRSPAADYGGSTDNHDQANHDDTGETDGTTDYNNGADTESLTLPSGHTRGEAEDGTDQNNEEKPEGSSWRHKSLEAQTFQLNVYGKILSVFSCAVLTHLPRGTHIGLVDDYIKCRIPAKIGGSPSRQYEAS
ncbi:hypothetical protein GE09DRAFT_1241707 [Coniochaeta sp. 2T2.1]|nr:hypothetical protein GE09DRAFT_1241707 [Coniochaeta sp. 2T2.1]